MNPDSGDFRQGANPQGGTQSASDFAASPALDRNGGAVVPGTKNQFAYNTGWESTGGPSSSFYPWYWSIQDYDFAWVGTSGNQNPPVNPIESVGPVSTTQLGNGSAPDNPCTGYFFYRTGSMTLQYTDFIAPGTYSINFNGDNSDPYNGGNNYGTIEFWAAHTLLGLISASAGHNSTTVTFTCAGPFQIKIVMSGCGGDYVDMDWEYVTLNGPPQDDYTINGTGTGTPPQGQWWAGPETLGGQGTFVTRADGPIPGYAVAIVGTRLY